MKKREQVTKTVLENYTKIARGEVMGCGCGCTPEADGSLTLKSYAQELGYTNDELAHLPDGANLGLGCGNPRLLADFKVGEIVLDLGSGGGVDCFNAAHAVGDTGHVIGVDMTPDMLIKSREHAANAKMSNVEFRLGEIENLPVANNEIDVIISNCVINLSTRKKRVYSEMFRVLKHGGRLAISDIVALQELPQKLQNNVEMISACVGGAQIIGGIEAMLKEIGFQNIRVEPMDGAREVIASWFPHIGIENYVTSASIMAIKP